MNDLFCLFFCRFVVRPQQINLRLAGQIDDSLNEATESFEIHVRCQYYPEFEQVAEADIIDTDGPTTTWQVDYAYDPSNQLVRRTFDADGDGAAAATDEFYSYQNSQVALQFDGSSASNLSHRYLWGPAIDQLLADETVTSLSSAGNVIWPLADQIGTIRDLASHNSSTNTTTIDNHRFYDSFGNLVSETSSAVDEIFAYTGRMFDEATGLQNNLNRWYDPHAGRWISEDPIGFRGGDTNLNRYVGNDPARSVDPNGLDAAIAGGGYHTAFAVGVWDTNGTHLGVLQVDFALDGWDGRASSCAGNPNLFFGAGVVRYTFTKGAYAKNQGRRVKGSIEQDRRMRDFLLTWSAGYYADGGPEIMRKWLDTLVHGKGGSDQGFSHYTYAVQGRNCNALTYYALKEYLGELPFIHGWGPLSGRGLTGEELLKLWDQYRDKNGEKIPTAWP